MTVIAGYCRLAAMCAAGLAAGVFVPLASAAPLSGELELRGTLATECTVVVTATGNRLDLVAGEVLKAVARVEETCNSEQGYTLTVSSRNGGALVDDGNGDGGRRVAYRVSYGGVSGTLEQPLTVTRQEPWFGRENDLLVSVTGDATLLAGIYRDEITVQVAAK